MVRNEYLTAQKCPPFFGGQGKEIGGTIREDVEFEKFS